MGQYHKFMNFDKKEVVDPGSPRKLTEWSYQENTYMLQVEHLLKTSWRGDRVFVVGDYVDEFYEDSTFSQMLENIRNENKEYNMDSVYHYPYKEISHSSFYQNRIASRYIYNDNKKQFLDLKNQPIQWVYYDENINYIGGAKFHPLSLILSCSNGTGGGDYYAKNMEAVGIWIEDSNQLFLSDEKLDSNYEEINIIFDESAITEQVKTNEEKLIEYIVNNFKKSGIKTINKIKFSPTLFLNEDERKNIIDKAIEQIRKKDLNKEKSDIDIEK